MLTEMYNRITAETDERLKEGARNLENLNRALLEEVNALKKDIAMMRDAVNQSFIDIRTEVGVEMDRMIASSNRQEGSVGNQAEGMLSDLRNKGIGTSMHTSRKIA